MSNKGFQELNLSDRFLVHERIVELKKNRDVEKRYMHYLSVEKIIEEKENALKKVEETLKETEKKADEATKKAQEIIREMLSDSIAELGTVSEVTKERIKKETDIDILNAMHKLAVKSDSMEQFEKEIVNLK